MDTWLPLRFDALFGLPVPELLADDTGWQARLLATPLLRCLTPVHWQQLLQRMSHDQVAAGGVVFEVGARADACFVLRHGLVRLHRGRRTLSILGPGELFGADAVVLGQVREASATLMTAGAVARLPAVAFEQWLEAALEPLERVGARQPLWIGMDRPSPRCLHLPPEAWRNPASHLSPEQGYAAVGGTPAERWLAAFLLAQQGFDVRPLGARWLPRGPRAAGPVTGPVA